jgi:peptidyl-dipeptidase Dcp
MRKTLMLGVGAAILALGAVAGCQPTLQTETVAPVNGPVDPAPAPAATGITLADWGDIHGGLPPFDKVQVADFEPAIRAAMDLARAEIAAIAETAEPASFDNVFKPLELSGGALGRVLAIYGIWSGSMSTPEFQAVESTMAPVLSAFQDEIYQNAALFARIEAAHTAAMADASLTAEQKRLADEYYKDFVRSGAKLDAEQKLRLAAINSELASLFTQFSQNVLADQDQTLFLTEAEMAGVPDSVRGAASAAATAAGQAGKFAIANTRSAFEPIMTFATDRAVRERVFNAFVNRGDTGGATDNNAIISKILKLRAERATMLGYATHAHWRLEPAMARTPERAMELMTAVWPAAVARVREEVADMQALANAEGANITIEPWDYRFYAEKVRKAKYDLDTNAVKPYLQLDKLVEGMFYVGSELFNFTFEPRTDVSVFHPDMKVWEVKDKATGRHVGMFYFDPYARAGKRSGAWMDSYRQQSRINGEVTTLVSNNSNFVKPAPGEPVLVSWDDATTLLHEFGHALHGLSANSTYPRLSGTAVARDYVEFPSQLLEHWLSTPEMLSRFALHYETGEAMPQELVDKIRNAAQFNQGFGTVEYLSSAIVDMRYHLAGGADIDPDAFEREILTEIGMPREIVMRHRSPHFLHVFSSDGYSAGYYSYLWSDTLTADAYEAFLEAGGPWDKAMGQKLVQYVFSTGNTMDPAEAYRLFRGADAGIEPLMRKRGFPVPGAEAGAGAP